MKYLFTILIACSLLCSGRSVALSEPSQGKWKPLEGDENKFIKEQRFLLKDVIFIDKYHGWIVGGGRGDERLILSTTDAGDTWKRQSREGKVSSYNFKHWGVRFCDKDTGWIVGDEGLILHTDTGGLLWSSQKSNIKPLRFGILTMPINDLYSAYFTDRENGWAVGFYGNILYTDNGGLMWQIQSSGTNNILWDVCFVDKDNGWAVGSEGTILHTKTGGNKWLGLFGGWEKQESGTYSSLYGVFFMDKRNGWAVGGGDILHTSDGGNKWEIQGKYDKTILRKVVFVNSTKGWAVGTDVKNGKGAIKFTVDGGKNWVDQESGTIYDLTSVFFIDENHGFAVGENGTVLRYVSDDRK